MCVHQGVTVCLDAMRQAFPATDSLQRTTKFFYSPTFRQSEAGIPIGPNSSTPASSRHMLNLYTTPAPAFEVRDEQLSPVVHDRLTVFETYSTFMQNVLILFHCWTVISSFRFPVRRTLSTCISCLLSKIPVWEHWSQTSPPQSSMLSVLYR